MISNNKLTDKCTEGIAGVLMRNKYLKTLMMHDNQILNRVAKNKLINSLSKINIVIWSICLPNIFKNIYNIFKYILI